MRSIPPAVRAASAVCAALLPVLAHAAPAAADGAELRPEQWGMEQIGAPAAAEANDGGGILVAVLDDGVDGDHPDLADAVTEGTDFTGGGGGPGASGTALAGVIAGRGHGREFTGGVVGVAPGADLLSVPVVAEGGGADRLAEAVRYAAGEGAQVITLPAGAATAEPDESVQAAVTYAADGGALVVAPAGEGESAYPGGYRDVLSVGAVTRDLALAAGSPAAEGVGLAAPGADITALEPGGGYTTAEGTGVATGFVAGTAALVRAEYPQLRPDEVAEVLTASAAAPPAGAGAPGYGAGVVDARAALEQAGSSAEGVPLYDEELARDADADNTVNWPLWSAVAAAAVLLVAAGVVLVRRATANPYGFPERSERSRRGGARRRR
ncbi:S8 family serine peptidase [Streptomonospora nanhaiensis]|uniref:Subtilisin family serine protease n=1 Tax=Streptomonospora nanhaiensis TaxID=1323731 RepID=A0A853BQ49_9ACTN|nr:S8 family serine peptidase [Streptomonospora nanhaiensis]MBX9388725.1 S8 family serine peptidase [Streptomonospora nanhaiensis]NYI96786.1 subtilisin family serine protease [Streptomonospora nanhaiensis]